MIFIDVYSYLSIVGFIIFLPNDFKLIKSI